MQECQLSFYPLSKNCLKKKRKEKEKKKRKKKEKRERKRTKEIDKNLMMSINENEICLHCVV